MTLSYLSAEDARLKLIAMGAYTEATAPPVAFLAMILESIEAAVNDWFGGCIAPTLYTELINTDSTTAYGLTTYYPVLSVLTIAPAPNRQMPVLVTPQQALTGMMRTIYLGGTWMSCLVTYRAGYDPLPQGFTNVMLAILKRALTQTDPFNLAWLTAPAKEVQSLTLPGGLSKVYSISKPFGAVGGTPITTELGKMLAPFARYRRDLVTVGANW